MSYLTRILYKSYGVELSNDDKVESRYLPCGIAVFTYNNSFKVLQKCISVADIFLSYCQGESIVKLSLGIKWQCS